MVLVFFWFSFLIRAFCESLRERSSGVRYDVCCLMTFVWGKFYETSSWNRKRQRNEKEEGNILLFLYILSTHWWGLRKTWDEYMVFMLVWGTQSMDGVSFAIYLTIYSTIWKMLTTWFKSMLFVQNKTKQCECYRVVAYTLLHHGRVICRPRVDIGELAQSGTNCSLAGFALGSWVHFCARQAPEAGGGGPGTETLVVLCCTKLGTDGSCVAACVVAVWWRAPLEVARTLTYWVVPKQ